MTTTTYALIGDLRTSEVLSGQVLQLLADRNALPNHPALMMVDLPDGSSTVKVPHIGLDGYHLLASTGDGSAVTPTQIADGSTTITVARYSKAYTPTDLARLTGGLLTDMAFARDAVVSASQTLVDIICGLVDDFSNTVGTSGNDATIADFMDAKSQLQLSNVQGPYLCILHPRQWADIEKEIATDNTNGSIIYDPANPAMLALLGNGYKGKLFGVDVFTSTRVPTANSGADRAGGMFGRGAIMWSHKAPVIDNPNEQVLLGPVLFERQRTALNGLTNFVSHYYVGASEGIDAAGVSIITDA